MSSPKLLLLLFVIPPTATTISCSKPLPYATTADNTKFCTQVFADGLSAPRGLFITEQNHVLVLERGKAQITALFDDDMDFVAETRIKIAAKSGLNHGLIVHGGYVYASTPTTVYLHQQAMLLKMLCARLRTTQSASPGAFVYWTCVLGGRGVFPHVGQHQCGGRLAVL